MHCMVVFMKDEGTNLICMATTLCFIVDCHPLKLQQVYEGTCFGHVMSETFLQYATNDAKVAIRLKHISLKSGRASLQKMITWTKKSRKRSHG